MPLRSWVREHDGQAVAVEVVEQVEDLVTGPHVDAGGGLVHEQEVGAAQQGPGDEHPLLLAAGQVADVAAAEAVDAEAGRAPRRPRRSRPARATAACVRGCGP